MTVDVFDDRVCRLGEGPCYDERTGRVWWVDILSSRQLWRDVRTGETGELPTTGHVGAAVLREGGGFVLCLPDGPVLADPDRVITPLGGYAEADLEAEIPHHDTAIRSNDAKADQAGRLWLGTMAYDESPGAGALYRLAPRAARPELVLAGVTISNGLAWSPDDSLMYYVDTPTGRVDVFDYDLATGEPRYRRPFVEIDKAAGSPDGICTDAEGAVWVALWGGGAVRRYLPGGRLDRVVEVGTPNVTSCAFAASAGGDALDLLVITTATEGTGGDPAAGRTYAYRPEDVVGLPVGRYGS
ncbi:MAG: SMP-30/gluconolactonase/LRE family protein [Micromonosporaceae bacterium]|nr:SMP-30/gluconolactonase/LRE family protein [Micromonosporaceae bacterium]